jgi:hypothetical protein
MSTLAQPLVLDCSRQIAQLRNRHVTMLWLSIGIILAAFLMQTRGHEQVAFNWLPTMPLPELCGSRAMFDVECPGCGLTRSFISLADGDFARSFWFNRVGWLLALAVVLQIPYRAYALWELKHRITDRRWPVWFGYFLIAALVGNWLLKVAGF